MTTINMLADFAQRLLRSLTVQGMVVGLIGLIAMLAAPVLVPTAWACPPVDCFITAIDTPKAIVTAKETGAGSTFQFTAPQTLLPQLKIGQKVWFDPNTQVVSVEGAPNCCRLAQSSPPPAIVGRPTLEAPAPVKPDTLPRGAPLKPQMPIEGRQQMQPAPSPDFRGPAKVATPPAPAGLTATPTSPTSVDLKWQPATGGAVYFVWRTTGPTNAFQQLNKFPLLFTEFPDNGVRLCGFTSYSYKVAARYPDGSEGLSTPVSVRAPLSWGDRYLDEQICGKRPRL